MKKIAVLMVTVLSLALFSFIAPPDNGITRTAAGLYSIAPLSKGKVSQADKDAILKIIKKEYKLTDAVIAKGVVLGSIKTASFTIFEKEVTRNWVDTRIWSMARQGGNESGQAIETILSKYASN